MRVRPRWYVVGVLLIVVVARAPRLAHAEGDRTETLRRAVSNVLLGPLDVALSPVVTAQALSTSAEAAGYSWLGTGALELIAGPGWYFPVTATAGVFRVWSGLAEMPVGLALLVTKSVTNWQPPAFFDVHEEPAMVSQPDAVIPIKFGVNYLGGESAR